MLTYETKEIGSQKNPTFHTDLVLWNSHAILSFKTAQEGFDAES